MILITGGLGYIGSHITFLLKNSAVVLDNMSNSNLNHVNTFPGTNVIKKSINTKSLRYIFKNFDIKSVIHLASLKSVNESVESPLKYYENNVVSTINLLKVMHEFNIKKLIFSSSCTIYGKFNKPPFIEKQLYDPINPYGNTKMLIEKLIDDQSRAISGFKAISLRYFNPVGSNYKHGLIEKPLGNPVNLMPLIIKSASGKGALTVFGRDYPTPDGTCVRDYIHVSDVANAHLKALKIINKIDGHEKINIGLGKGLSVLDLIKIFEKVNKVKVPYKIGKRRYGDVPVAYADNKKAKKLLKWEPKKNYIQMCQDAWKSHLINK